MSAAPRPSYRDLLRRPHWWLAFGGGVGLAPRAPGTAGTLVAVPLWWWAAAWPPWAYGLLLVGVIGAGPWLCGRTAAELGCHDHPGIVWDEIAGFLLAMTAVAPSWTALLAGFASFRFFDAVKPWPIRWLDRRLGGGWGIMADDLAAGLATAAVLHLAASLWG
ncbi:MAG: phosphatidylglycerophosphatase A [Gammaproteobacteria bacterium]|nr:MAG: phosphatidylglycerophosphatase A [Gammaproteobacteria bacterium]